MAAQCCVKGFLSSPPFSFSLSAVPRSLGISVDVCKQDGMETFYLFFHLFFPFLSLSSAHIFFLLQFAFSFTLFPFFAALARPHIRRQLRFYRYIQEYLFPLFSFLPITFPKLARFHIPASAT